MSGSEHPHDRRSMVSPRRSVSSDGGHRVPAARDPGAPPPLTSMRRLGVGVVIGALLVSIALAMGGPSRPGAGPPDPTIPPGTQVAGATPTPGDAATRVPTGPVPVVAPLVVPPDDPVLTTRKVTLTVSIPDPGEPLKDLELRVYRNDEPAMDPLRVKSLTMNVRDIPLKRNQNRITMAIANAAGEGPRSEPVILTVDDKDPKLEIKGPDEGSIVNSTLATVRGITEPGLTVTVRNPGYGDSAQVVADERGVFMAEVRLDKGTNRLEITTADAAGNAAKRIVNVVRGDTEPSAELSLSKPELRLSQLPDTINIKLELKDPQGDPVDGATVTFTLVPPGLGAETYTTTTEKGIARWDGVLIQGASRGFGEVTARAELGEGVGAATAWKPLRIK